MKLKKIVLGVVGSNCYILSDENTKKAVVIDAPDNAYDINEYIRSNGYIAEKILLTHGHFDHILALEKLKMMTGAKVYIHKNEEKFLHDNDLNLVDRFGAEYSEADADVLVEHNDEIQFSGHTIKVLYTPGHTSGSVCYLINNMLFSGDTLFENSIGTIDFPTGNWETLKYSIKSVLMKLPDDITVYPGHGGSTTIGRERKENEFIQ